MLCVVAIVPLVAWASEPSAAGGLTVPLAALLGVIQGATEFLPVSSSGHLALAQRFFGIDAAVAGHRFNIAAHAGTLLAVLWVYRRDVARLLGAVVAPHRPGEPRRWVLAIIVATLPLLVFLAPGLEEAVVAIEGRPRLVGAALVCTAAILWVSFRKPLPLPDPPRTDAPGLGIAVGIGFAQLFAVLPGISRSGSTIAAGLLLGLDRERAARFSFLISIPAIGGATILELRKVLREDAVGLDPLPYAVGFVTALAVGFVCLRWLLLLVRRGEIRPFVVYLLALGSLAVALG